MYPKKQEEFIDITGVKLLPGDPEHCAGNGKADSMKCCCDECEHFLSCFPEWDEQGEEFQKIVGAIPTIGEK